MKNTNNNHVFQSASEGGGLEKDCKRAEDEILV